MSNKREKLIEKFDRLSDCLSEDIDEMLDSELIEEILEDGESIDAISSSFYNIILNASNMFGKYKLKAARMAYDKSQKNMPVGKVFHLSLEDKKRILHEIIAKDPQFEEKLTMAARNSSDLEKDVDSILFNLVELGFIDTDGKICK